ncbi:MAG: DUF72 domain-containing protein [Meiothermus sp.]|uniref:DUF72 domain-containing protein n=1 Tax=Meiothermus sp. TaxID=1955249 RepID=UPI0025E968A9|nr:DUF72 domain-containing protein [Meiothermus sp.]MCS7058373.1 DUF72 domain-containing protein [Meiothermus sp.]MCS7194379.1 DUF72 domain-containing protein [Meiothermus sp.]MCX7739863.1 DUF72 domain-containing protein [Meiothermus sp.]MDW8089860.1 DUF72 domain-containing protein [Meiothermus sp.]MDW8481714.1 DUF72 domain-containing protein [Meiothermus sp.]
MELYLGTGGYTHEDWVGLLYPPDAKKEDWLSIYAQHHNAVELNASFYHIPGVKAFAGMLRRSQGRVRWAVKLHQSMTHQRNATEADYQRLFESVAPLREAGVLGPFLAQFPQSFHRTPENRKYLAGLAQRFADPALAPGGLAVEFRHASWDTEAVRQAFRQSGLIWVSPDYPALPGLPKSALHITSETAYIRLSGRNRTKWYEGKDQSERHDYRYSEEELRFWVRALQTAVEQVSIAQVWFIFNNTTKGHALVNLTTLRALLEEAGF